MAKALSVIAECVDIRSGARFKPGDTFNPAPTVSQAVRLIAAGCLPEAAKAAAVQDEDPAEMEQAAQKATRLDAAQQEFANAEIELSAALDLKKAAQSDDDKKDAADAVAAAEARLKKAKADISKLSK